VRTTRLRGVGRSYGFFDVKRVKMRRYYKDSYEYQRIMEILDDYWLTCPDELYVKVSMDFIKADGQNECKTIVWRNPAYEVGGEDELDPGIIDVGEYMWNHDIDAEFEKAHPEIAFYEKAIHEGKVRIKNAGN
jgi:hypothetical protein